MANRTLRAGYAAAASGLKLAARRSTAKDFRNKTSVLAGEYPTLAPLNEHGEIKSGTLAELAESYRLKTFARRIGMTRQALVNDDLGAFGDLARNKPP